MIAYNVDARGVVRMIIYEEHSGCHGVIGVSPLAAAGSPITWA